MTGRQKTYFLATNIYTKKTCCSSKRSLEKQDKALVLRAKVILTTAENPDWTDAQIAQNIGCSQALVRKWRKRWCQTRSLEEAPRPGRPRIFEALIRALFDCVRASRCRRHGL